MTAAVSSFALDMSVPPGLMPVPPGLDQRTLVPERRRSAVAGRAPTATKGSVASDGAGPWEEDP